MADGWYVRFAEGISGPYDKESLLDKRRAGEINDNVLISEDQNAWICAGDFFETFSQNAAEQNDGQAEGDTPPIQGFSAAAGPTGRRDRIVILGRRRAGKTIYISTLYARLWKSLDGLTMSSLSGVAHRDAMRAVALLEKGAWPEATDANSEMAYELNYRGQKRLMVTLEYSGEVFRRAFVEDDHEDAQVKQLLNHLDNAAGVLLLIDPSVVYEGHRNSDTPKLEPDSSGGVIVDGRYLAIDAAVDDDYGMVQAVKRVRNWPDGKNVPVAIVLTKMDQNHDLVKKEGGGVSFVKNHWPALARTLKRVPIFTVSAVQAKKNSEGKLYPNPSSEPVHLEKPLKFCLKVMDKLDDLHKVKEMQEAKESSLRHMEEHVAEEARRKKVFWNTVIIGIILVGAFIIALIIIFSH